MIQIFDKFGKLKSSGIPGFGTVTSVSSGNLSPLFTSSVTSSTSTPNITFAPINQAQKLFYASPHGSTGTPSFRAIQASDLPSLSGIYVPVSRNLTINGVTYDLSADRTWTISTAATWGSITGTLTAQTDLTLYLSTNYFPLPTGTISEYIDGTGALQSFPSIPAVDATPTDGSSNAVSSNGVFDALATKFDKENNFFLNWFPTGSIITINNYTSTVSSTAFSSTTSNSNNLTKFQPFVTNKTITIDELYLSLATANNGTGSTATLYIFDDSNDGLPGVKLHQEITATGIFTAGNSIISFTNNITLQPGVYWIGIHIRNLNTAGTNPTFYHASLGGNTKGYQTAAISFTNNYLGTLFVGATTGDLGNNPTILASTGTNLLVPMLKIKLG